MSGAWLEIDSIPQLKLDAYLLGAKFSDRPIHLRKNRQAESLAESIPLALHLLHHRNCQFLPRLVNSEGNCLIENQLRDWTIIFTHGILTSHKASRTSG